MIDYGFLERRLKVASGCVILRAFLVVVAVVQVRVHESWGEERKVVAHTR